MIKISPLRQRFIDDMNLAGLVHGTQETTIRAVLTCVLCAAAKETRCGNISPERITEEQLATSIRLQRDCWNKAFPWKRSNFSSVTAVGARRRFICI